MSGSETRGHFVPPHAYEMYLRGELLLQKGQAAAAAEALELALAAPELDPFVLARLALALYRAGRAEQAAARLGQLQELAPCEPELWLVRARIAEDRNDPPGALTAVEHALSCDPEHVEAQRARLELLTETGAHARARALMDDGRAPVPPLALREAALREAVEAGELETIRSLLPPERLVPHVPWVLRARALSRLGETQAAARAIRRAAPLRPADLPEAARILAEAGALEEAERAAEVALASELELDETQQLALHAVRARALYARGEISEAVRELPRRERRTLAEWLERAGAPGLAAELQ